MTGEYVEDRDNQHHHHHHPPANPNPNPHFFSNYSTPLPLHPFPTKQTPSKKPKTTATTTSDDGGAIIEVSRRPRGRPPGSKNKPKPPIIITHQPQQPPMSICIIQLPPSSDIILSLSRFSLSRSSALCVLAASGSVANATLKQPSLSTFTSTSTITFHGKFDILSLSAAILLDNHNIPTDDGRLTFAITLSSPQGQIVGGKVVAPLVAATTVYVIAAAFDSPSFHRLPEDDAAVEDPDGGCGGGGGGGGMGVYGCHVGFRSSEVMWGPTSSRTTTTTPPPPPPPPPPPY